MVIGVQGFFFILGNQLLKNVNIMLEYWVDKDYLIVELEIVNVLLDDVWWCVEVVNFVKFCFLVIMSYELCMLLNVIFGFFEIMKDEVFGLMDNKIY